MVKDLIRLFLGFYLLNTTAIAIHNINFSQFSFMISYFLFRPEMIIFISSGFLIGCIFFAQSGVHVIHLINRSAPSRNKGLILQICLFLFCFSFLLLKYTVYTIIVGLTMVFCNVLVNTPRFYRKRRVYTQDKSA